MFFINVLFLILIQMSINCKKIKKYNNNNNNNNNNNKIKK